MSKRNAHQYLERMLSHQGDRRRIAALLERRWSLPAREDHPLGRLQNRALGPVRLLVLLGPKNAFGASYFQVFLRLADGRLSGEPLLLGLHNSGRYPAYNWIDVIRYEDSAVFENGERLDLAADGLDRRLFRLLGQFIPPGGHLMVEYESEGQRPTERMLTLGVPPAATPLGYLFFLSGCGASFRDWYISEGGREGPRKLQGFRPLDTEDARRKAQSMAEELRQFLARAPEKEHRWWEKLARRLAQRVLKRLETSEVAAEQG
ncbi:MAG: DUF1122 family protein [Dehalococcoidia bacterium]|nr:MAG: DUF1122 family protein [Dehalococcoidia bacterium]